VVSCFWEDGCSRRPAARRAREHGPEPEQHEPWRPRQRRGGKRQREPAIRADQLERAVVACQCHAVEGPRQAAAGGEEVEAVPGARQEAVDEAQRQPARQGDVAGATLIKSCSLSMIRSSSPDGKVFSAMVFRV
jgi:hypothetical protein